MKKPIFKKWWFWVIVVLVLGMIGSAMGGDKEADATPSVSQTVETATPEPSATPSATPEPSDTGTTLDVAAALLELQIAENFDNYKVDVDEEAKLITVSIWMDGVALEAVKIKDAGGDATDEDWATMKDNLISLNKSMKNVVDSLGIEKAHVALNLLNDQNLDNVLLCILDDTVMCDVME